eukprot:CAMPEP_0181242070 /NCGR_PEP_ID=MMETSP1096-20121128/41477_1 /TAXON_ID=156174 ORGANISM="Chrysochromulina ericina, Strain CCMP281" /NCGR_SAMPLE_ID=MMETSP1096 /ASSEMBLY_ACC=CAM_ASM_000453 /LENGTH=173 /DNA_ID=CAMNT_0023338221 /DNA_START=246 /DNA_END=769 /DNA_ORIENTATION=-
MRISLNPLPNRSPTGFLEPHSPRMGQRVANATQSSRTPRYPGADPRQQHHGIDAFLRELEIVLALAHTSFYSLHELGVVVPELFAASMLAGDSVFGSASIEMTESKMDSAVCIGRQRSAAASYPYESSPGACKMLQRKGGANAGIYEQLDVAHGDASRGEVSHGRLCGCAQAL